MTKTDRPLPGACPGCAGEVRMDQGGDGWFYAGCFDDGCEAEAGWGKTEAACRRRWWDRNGGRVWARDMGSRRSCR